MPINRREIRQPANECLFKFLHAPCMLDRPSEYRLDHR
jgi:hypothetical protein